MNSVSKLLIGKVFGLEALFVGILCSLSVEEHVAVIGGSVVTLADSSRFGVVGGLNAFSDGLFMELSESGVVVDVLSVHLHS